MDIEAFLAANKSIVIAPAGYGKTYTIAEAIAAYRGKKKVLVLTHTHAGIASLREKFQQRGLPSNAFHLDTICSFALELTKTYHINKAEIPRENDASAMFDFAVQHAEIILKAKPIKQLIAIRYDHLIVDEYQDCTIAQHKMILELSESLKTHLLGDPLQGIFGFRGQPIVDFNDSSFSPFMENSQSLETPWRWMNAGQAALGNDLARIRERLLSGQDIDLRDYASICWVCGQGDDYAKPGTAVKLKLFQEINQGAVIIHPNTTSVNPRKNVVQQYKQLQLIEAIDGKEYYQWCAQFDSHSGLVLVKDVADMMRSACNKTCINNWFKADGSLVNKRNQAEIEVQSGLSSVVNPLVIGKSYLKIARLIAAITKLPDQTVYRKEFVKDIYHTLVDADRLGLSASEAIARNRNILRRKGRKVSQKSIGNTLLTKGLEFDTVVVLNAQDIKDPKHLYVALTRCCQKLVVIADKPVLHPYSV